MGWSKNEQAKAIFGQLPKFNFIENMPFARSVIRLKFWIGLTAPIFFGDRPDFFVGVIYITTFLGNQFWGPLAPQVENLRGGAESPPIPNKLAETPSWIWLTFSKRSLSLVCSFSLCTMCAKSFQQYCFSFPYWYLLFQSSNFKLQTWIFYFKLRLQTSKFDKLSLNTIWKSYKASFTLKVLV